MQAVPGAIGYVQYSYAHLTKMQMASMQNRAGEFIAPNSESFEAAVRSFKADLDPTHAADPVNPDAYPILSLSWMILRRDYADNKAEVLKDVLSYCLTDGQKVADRLGYIPLNQEAVDVILQHIDAIN